MMLIFSGLQGLAKYIFMPNNILRVDLRPRNKGNDMSSKKEISIVDSSVRTALKTSLYPGASDASVDLVLAYCAAYQLDPMTKPVHVVPMKIPVRDIHGNIKKTSQGYDIKESRDVIMPGIALYRIKAAETGAYLGCSDPIYGPDKTLEYEVDNWIDGKRSGTIKKTLVYPESCTITVKRLVNGKIAEFTSTERWLENYATVGYGDTPNAMWVKRPYAQLAKCTEAQGLRKAFPGEVGSQPTYEEMEGKEYIDTTATEVQPEPIKMPEPKKEAQATPAPAKTEEKGFNDLQENQIKMVRARAAVAGLDTDEKLFEQFPSITKENINNVLAGLRDMQ